MLVVFKQLQITTAPPAIPAENFTAQPACATLATRESKEKESR
jgi:hypothetical protein